MSNDVIIFVTLLSFYVKCDMGHGRLDAEMWIMAYGNIIRILSKTRNRYT